jgi:lipoyl-dependent peroxiredoxin
VLGRFDSDEQKGIVEMADRTATTRWQGGLADGKGQTSFDSSGIGTYDVSWPARTEEPEGMTSPEELIAAAHASCFSMALSKQVADAGGTPKSFETSATVTLQAGSISRIALRVRGEVDGLDDEGFRSAAEAAKGGCPVSKLVAGNTEVTLDAALA